MFKAGPATNGLNLLEVLNSSNKCSTCGIQGS